MRHRSIVLCLCLMLMGSTAFGQSLGEVAKKEKKRRDKNETKTHVIDDEALSDIREIRQREGGTSSPPPSSSNEEDDAETASSGGSGASGTSSSSSLGPALQAHEKRTLQREQALKVVDKELAGLSPSALRLVNSAMNYRQHCANEEMTPTCRERRTQLRRDARMVGFRLDSLLQFARQNGVSDSEFRGFRAKHGLDNEVWDVLQRVSARWQGR